MDHYQTETTLVLAKFGINDVNTYRFQMERSECEASIMGVPPTHIFTLHRNKLKAFTRFIRLVVVKLTAVRREGDTVSCHSPPPGPWWSGDVTLCHDVSHAGLRAPDHADGPPGASLTLGDHSLCLWPLHWTQHN